ncbi:MAG: response regulator [Proteobacteria bacterium]|nr:response regulator [Pseudomonadota bacterium]
MTDFKVLLVDDEEEFLDTLGNRLQNRSLEVMGAASGEEALSILEGYQADVVVLDVRMPGIGGIETLKEIKRTKPLTEVIILTGYASTHTAIQVMELGAFDYLVKPIDIDELLYRLHDAYKKKSLKERTNIKSHQGS